MIDSNIIINGLVDVADVLVYTLTPFALMYLGIRLAITINRFIGAQLSKAFAASEPPLSGKDFEAKYGPLDADLRLLAGEIYGLRQSVDKRFAPLMLAFAALAFGVIAIMAAALASGNPLPAFPLLVVLILALFLMVVVYTVHVMRAIGPQYRAWKAQVRERHQVAPGAVITLRIARR